MKKPTVTIVIGTRPEAIKMAPVFLKFHASNIFNIRLITTGQHLEMVDQILNFFQIVPDLNLNIMKKYQTLEYVTSEVMKGVMEDLEKNPAMLLLVQGDTTTAFAASLGAFYSKVPIAHVEAGLRTDNIFDPTVYWLEYQYKCDYFKKAVVQSYDKIQFWNTHTIEFCKKHPTVQSNKKIANRIYEYVTDKLD